MHIIVLGGGIVGVTTAHALINDGHEVTIVDRQPGVAMECSHANGGYVAISQAVPWSAPGVPLMVLKELLSKDASILLHPLQLPRIWRWGLDFLRASRASVSSENMRHVLRLALYSFEALKETRAETGVEYAPVQTGCLKVFSDEETLAEAVGISEAQRSMGLRYRALSPEECVELEPALTPSVQTLSGGIHYPDEEGGDCYAYAQGLAEWCRARGARFSFSTTAKALEVEGGRVVGVETDRGSMRADAAVLALGADSPLIMKPLGVRLPIIPVKGYSFTFPRAIWPGAPRMPVLDEKRKFGYAPLGEERLRMCGFAEIAGYDTVPEEGRGRALLDSFVRLFPEFGAPLAKVEPQAFCCLRPVTPSGLPILGSSHYANLYYNVGQGHLGWTLAHGCARIIAALIAGRDPGIDMTGYRPLATQ